MNISLSALRSMSVDEVASVAQQLRTELTVSILENSGHFASSLGVAELTLAIHRVFNTPTDRVVWDVGHQAYLHKLVSGRGGCLSSIRRSGGVSGYLKRTESQFDVFGAGHAGTSISAALGIALSSRENEPSREVVAVIGDGAFTAGMAFEALNHAGGLALTNAGRLQNFTVVLNDNGMSIDSNVGALHQRCSSRQAPLSSFMETLGFTYLGVIDGHDQAELEHALACARDRHGPTLVHVKTIKGKGYEAAESDPCRWHAVANSGSAARTYTSAFSAALLELAQSDCRILAITAAMAGGTGLDAFRQQLPERFYDAGICEQHAVTLAAGFATEGFRPVVAIYSTFLQRAFDQVLHDVCIQNLPVTFVLDRAGLVGNDGETHQGVFDIAYLRTIPNLSIAAPSSESDLRTMLEAAVRKGGPAVIRFPRGAIPRECSELAPSKITNQSRLIRAGSDVLLVGLGPTVAQAQRLALRAESEFGLSVGVLDARYIKPLDEATLTALIPNYSQVVTLEDGSLAGGFGAAVLEFLMDAEIRLLAPLKRFGVPDRFVTHGTQEEQREWCNMDDNAVMSFMKRLTPQTLRNYPKEQKRAHFHPTSA